MDPKYQPGDRVRIKASDDLWEIDRLGKVGPFATEPQYAVIVVDQPEQQRRVVRESLITELVGRPD